MPEVYSMSRWNEEDKYGDKAMIGDRVVRSIRHKRKKEKTKRGCPKNNYGAHLFACTKYITFYTERDRRYKNLYEHYTVYCLFCDHEKRPRRYWNKKPSVSIECLTTVVERRGPWQGGYWTNCSTMRYAGETDKDGKATTR